MKKFILCGIMFLSLAATASDKVIKSLENPDYASRKDGSLKIKLIELYTDSTVVTFDGHNYSGKTITVNNNLAIQSRDKILKPIDAHGITFGVPAVLPESNTIEFKLVYPPIKNKNSNIDFVNTEANGNSIIIKGLRLDGKRYARITSDQWLKENTATYPGKPDTLIYNEPKKARISGKFTSYDTEMHGKSFIIHNKNEFTDVSKPIVVDIADDGTFDVEIDCSMPKNIYAIICSYIPRSIYIEPERELKLFFDFDRLIGQYFGVENQRTTIFNGGELGAINEELIMSPNTWAFSIDQKTTDSVGVNGALDIIKHKHIEYQSQLQHFFDEYNISEYGRELISNRELSKMAEFTARFVQDATYNHIRTTHTPFIIPDSIYTFLNNGFGFDEIAIAATFSGFYNAMAFSSFEQSIGVKDEYPMVVFDYGLAYLKNRGAKLSEDEEYKLNWITEHEGETIWTDIDSIRTLQQMPQAIANRSGLAIEYKALIDSLISNQLLPRINHIETMTRNISYQAKAVADFCGTESAPLWWQITKASYLASYGGTNTDFTEMNDIMEILKRLRENGSFTSDAVYNALTTHYLTAYSPFELPDNATGNLIRKMLAPHKGKYVIMDIWATTCGPCRAEIEQSKEFRLKNRGNDDFTYLFVSSDNNSPLNDYNDFVKAHLEGEDCHYLSADEYNRISELFEFNSIPRYIMFDRDGKVVSRNLGHTRLHKMFLEKNGINFIN